MGEHTEKGRHGERTRSGKCRKTTKNRKTKMRAQMSKVNNLFSTYNTQPFMRRWFDVELYVKVVSFISRKFGVCTNFERKTCGTLKMSFRKSLFFQCDCLWHANVLSLVSIKTLYSDIYSQAHTKYQRTLSISFDEAHFVIDANWWIDFWFLTKTNPPN